MANPPRTRTTNVTSQPSRTVRPKGPRSNENSGDNRGIVFARFKLGRAFSAESPNFYWLAGTTILTVLIGLLMVLSASAVDSFLQDAGFFGAFSKQFAAAALGIPLMLFISRWPKTFFRKWAMAMLILSGLFQLLVFSPLGYEAGGNRNWIAIGSMTAQPSEFIKLAVAIWLGVYLPPIIERNGPSNWRVLLPTIPVFLLIGLVLAGGDMGTSIIIFLVILGALIFSGVSWRIISIPVLAGALAAVVLSISRPSRVTRIMSFLNDNCSDFADTCWQPLHGKWALANGGIFGVGLGQSKAKWSWLPAADNDFIFAVIGEELGLIGALVVIGLFVAITVVFLRIIRSARDPMVRITTGALMFWIIGEAFINIGVVVGILPVLGVPLPLLSSGGTSLLLVLVAIGVVLSFTRDEPPIKRSRR